MSHTTVVAVPSITPLVGPMGYVFELSQPAETVRWVGVTRTSVKDQPKVMTLFVAIL